MYYFCLLFSAVTLSVNTVPINMHVINISVVHTLLYSYQTSQFHRNFHFLEKTKQKHVLISKVKTKVKTDPVNKQVVVIHQNGPSSLRPFQEIGAAVLKGLSPTECSLVKHHAVQCLRSIKY